PHQRHRPPSGRGAVCGTIAHSLLLPFRIYEDRRSGELLHTMQRARNDAEQSITWAARLYLGCVGMVTVLAYAFYVHALLGALQAALIAILAAFMLVVSKPI